MKEAALEEALSRLSLATALSSHVATTTGGKASTAVTLEASTALATSAVTTATARTTAASAVAIATVGVATGTALLDEDLLATHLVRIGSDSSSIPGGLGEFNKSAVLKQSTSKHLKNILVNKGMAHEPWHG